MSAEHETPVAQPAVTTEQQQPRITSPEPTANTNSAAQYSYYQPYPGNQPQGPPGAYNLAAPPNLPQVHHNKAWEITKFVLNAAVFVFSIIGMAIGLSLLSSKYKPDHSYDDDNGYAYRYYDYDDNSIIFIIVGTPIVCSLSSPLQSKYPPKTNISPSMSCLSFGAAPSSSPVSPENSRLAFTPALMSACT